MMSVNEDEERKNDIKKVLLSKKLEKTYKVTVTYIQLSDEAAKTKLSIIESIMKKSFKNKED